MRVDPGMGGLLYVVGNRPRESQLAFGSELGAQVLYLDELTAAALRTDPTIVFDLDLRKIDVVRKLKSLCNRQGPGCKIFLVDTSSRVATVHGRVLGASAILSNSAKPSEIHAAIKAHFGITQREQKVDAAVRDSINSGVMALKSGFAAIDENLMFNLAGATATSDRIVDAIGLPPSKPAA